MQAGFVVRRLLGCTCQPAGTNHKVVKVVRRHLASLATSVARCLPWMTQKKKIVPLLTRAHVWDIHTSGRPGPGPSRLVPGPTRAVACRP